jgi:tRNA 2-thiouridine synthesizing protein A
VDIIDVELDTRDMYCPMPIVKLKKTTKTMEPGQIVKLVATNPGSTRDVPAWTNKTGAKTLESNEENGEYIFIIKVN